MASTRLCDQAVDDPPIATQRTHQRRAGLPQTGPDTHVIITLIAAANSISAGSEGEASRWREPRQHRRSSVKEWSPGGHTALFHDKLRHAQGARRYGENRHQPAALSKLVEDGRRDLRHRALDQNDVIRPGSSHAGFRLS